MFDSCRVSRFCFFFLLRVCALWRERFIVRQDSHLSQADCFKVWQLRLLLLSTSFVAFSSAVSAFFALPASLPGFGCVWASLAKMRRRR